MGYSEIELPEVSSQHHLAALMLASLSTRPMGRSWPSVQCDHRTTYDSHSTRPLNHGNWIIIVSIEPQL